jgi:hypothetical protein
MWCYKVRWYDESMKDMRISEGLVCADTAQEVMEYLHAYYGDIDLAKIAAIEEGDYECHILPFEGIDANWTTFVKDENF